ncbi:putative gustatory receptor 2a [Lucilia cuprina]|uniref:putative gustatory receptor 2a n=1 Tax=Lucilia cuprina TaxID=7375 RepID=UPI001F06161F|nr:putative gustatory receptor 2a [Lucilia cuprina]
MLKRFFDRVKNYFFDKFQTNEFAYVLYPFLRIFKLFGFLPVQLEPNELLSENYKFKLDKWSFVATFIGSIVFIVGFYFGVIHLSHTKNLAQLHESTVIAYFTTWGQIVFLFVLASYGLLNTWFNISKMHGLFLWISKIDHQLEEVTGRELNYTRMRKKLFIQFFVVFLVPSCLSMVNCIVLHFGPNKIDIWSTCFWFVCFAPILLLTFKEFQFYNLMFVLKTKFDIINKELLQYGGDNLLSRRKKPRKDVLNSVKPACSTDIIRKLLEIYSNTADCVDLLLKVFGWHLLLFTSASFGVITVQGYNLFAALIVHTMEMDGYQLTVVTGWILVQILIIGLNVGTCGMTSRAMSLTGPLLHRIKTNSLTNCSFYLNVQLFSHEVLHRKNNFSAAGFIDMDYKLITSIIAAVTTYLLIIIQFHFSSLQKKIASD